MSVTFRLQTEDTDCKSQTQTTNTDDKTQKTSTDNKTQTIDTDKQSESQTSSTACIERHCHKGENILYLKSPSKNLGVKSLTDGGG